MAKSPSVTETELNGLQKSAILMLSLGEDSAAAVFRHLQGTEVQELGAAIANLKQISRQDVNSTLSSFRDDAEQFLAVSIGSDDYIRAVLTKALGSERAAGIIDDILEVSSTSSGIDTLNWMDASVVAELIGGEHPQIIATILVHLKRDRSAAILNFLPARLRTDVMLRIATFGGVQPAALAELTTTLSTLLSGQGAKRSNMGGVRTAAEILNMMSTSDEKSIVDALRERDNDLTQRIVDEMFVFENLLEMDDRSIQTLLKEIEGEVLTIALKGAPEDLREKFLGNMSVRAAQILREDIEMQGPVRMSQVETEQKKILAIAKRLAEDGQIALGTQGNDAYV
ncbi:flagellar motor switch protein FliG [Kerstersia gyiorum]|uniref:Flagellar motor switch protein FliG n=1 Tax=Kerstersia gyiorum TaxID=206506 RepID=A0A171KRE8_9BURK|nr:flagellar motor switch protein FliG [Kerstersia gyiorum]KAB0544454.1 flagellar motor switch protein FliG [Kerstersia gyiorum]KKO71465.1 flagellar motor switch protein G [Kerstersia gyiorum]MCR4159126.1 flagellar motor switch protein FliG [Kerstersia gyiorum]QBR39977.1 flagellar motor switch protein FliG [Kerstersia gyiorum]RZS69587.1 flagellar motor switch protein FliG [Kerstersia gyiorum]